MAVTALAIVAMAFPAVAETPNSAGQKGPGVLARALIEAVIGPGTAPVAGTFGGDLSSPFT